MAEKKNEYPPSVEANRRLLPFDTWEDYLDSLIEIADLRNLRSIESARTIAALGYRANGDTLTEKEFYARRAEIYSIVYPTVKAYVQVSEGAEVEDPFNRELAIRERANRVGILQTVIFVRHFTKCGFEISGYIDYAHRLIAEDWGPFFKSNKMLWPTDKDLGYYHWRHGTVRSNISRNYKAIQTDGPPDGKSPLPVDMGNMRGVTNASSAMKAGSFYAFFEETHVIAQWKYFSQNCQKLVPPLYSPA